MESILRARAEFMAERTAKDSATRGDATKSEVAVNWCGETKSSMIQPRHACPEEGFHAASVKIEVPWSLGFGSTMIKGFVLSGGGGVCASIHSLASEIALEIVSSGVEVLFWKIN